ncbi:MAG: glutathione S-transferase [Caulobacteraceae bacterium]
MKLYMERDPAPNPRRVGIYLREKGIELETVRVNIRERAHKAPEHLQRNSLGQLPVLELDDGRMLCESVSICLYLEGMFPEPPLFGRDAYERALIDMWIRRIEFNVAIPVGLFWRHRHPLTAHLLEQHLEFGESNRVRVAKAMRWLDGEMGSRDAFIAGEAFSMADIVAVATIDFATLIGLPVPEDCEALLGWRERMDERASVAMPSEAQDRYRMAVAAVSSPHVVA